MTGIVGTGELVLIGCGEVCSALIAEPSLYGIESPTLRYLPLPGPANIATQADELLNTLDPARHRLFIAVDSNALNYARLELYAQARLKGLRMATLIHTRAIVSPEATIGDNVWVGAGAVIAAGCKLGGNTLVGANARLDANVSVGAHVWLGPGCRIGSDSHIGQHGLIGADVQLRAHTRVGRHCLIDQPGPWQGEVASGTFAVAGYATPARLVGAGYSHSVRGVR